MTSLNQIVKVDRVCSSEEAGQLEDLGVNTLGVCFENRSKFSDRRSVPKREAIAMFGNFPK